MRLTLHRDGDSGTPVASVALSDHPDQGELQQALNELVKQAQWQLVGVPEAAAKAAEERVKNREQQFKEEQEQLERQFENQQRQQYLAEETARLSATPAPESQAGKQQSESHSAKSGSQKE